MGNCLGKGSKSQREDSNGGSTVGCVPITKKPEPAEVVAEPPKLEPETVVDTQPRLPKHFNEIVPENPFPDLVGRDITEYYNLGRELGRGEFGVTCLVTSKTSGEQLACKSIPKRKLKTAIDIEDVRREVAIMHHLPKHPNIVGLKGVFEDKHAVHIVQV